MSTQHIMVRAGAGCGKTFAIEHGVNHLFAMEDPCIFGSEEQVAIWDAIMQGVQPGRRRFVTACAFNTSICKEMASRLHKDARVRTLNSLGNGICWKHLKCEVEPKKLYILLESLVGENLYTFRKQNRELVGAVIGLTHLCKQNLLGDPSNDDLHELAMHYGHDDSDERTGDLVRQLLAKSMEVTNIIDFTDQIWLPIAMDLGIFKANDLFVDEAQDMNRCQQELAKRAGRRLIIVGDPNQAIYGFAGADNQSMERLQKKLHIAEAYPLMETRRCARSIVDLAKELVPDFRAHESNPEGAVNKISSAQFGDAVGEGDMVLCRTNAPLVSHCFRLLAQGRPAYIQGRNVGDSLIALIKKFDVPQVDAMIRKLEDYESAETAKLAESKYPTDEAQIALQDKCGCLRALADGKTTCVEVAAEINRMFPADNKTPKHAVRLSSMHRAKGLEADRVHILRPDLLPHPMAKQDWAQQQERNLQYVAYTRAKTELNIVYGDDD